MRTDALERLLIDFIEEVGDGLGVQFRNGTGVGGVPHQTNKEAWSLLYKTLSNYKTRINQVALAHENNGKSELQAQLRDMLLGVKETEYEDQL